MLVHRVREDTITATFFFAQIRYDKVIFSPVYTQPKVSSGSIDEDITQNDQVCFFKLW